MELHMTERTWVGNGARCLLRGECSVPARGEQEPSTRRVAIQRRAFGIGLLSLLPFLAIACAKGLDEPSRVSSVGDKGVAAGTETHQSAPSPRRRGKQSKGEKLVHLEASLGGTGSVLGKVEYKVKGQQGSTSRGFEVELEQGKPGDVYTVALDGIALGQITIGADGEGDLEFSDDGEPFPENFPEPRAGSVLNIGDLVEAKLEDLLAESKKP